MRQTTQVTMQPFLADSQWDPVKGTLYINALVVWVEDSLGVHECVAIAIADLTKVVVQ